MHEALISGFNVLYLFGDSNLNKGLETAMAVCAGEADVPFAVHATGPGVLALSSGVRSALLKSKAATQVACILADIWWGWEGTSTWETKAEICHQGDLKSIRVAFWGLEIEPTAPAFARQALYH